MIEKCIADISKLKTIPPQSADQYADAMERMIHHVNLELGGRPDITALIGHNPLQMMEMNHRNHAQFMLTVGIIPICMYCKNIRDDKELWHKLEQYISDHTDALFSHGICPVCFEEHFGEISRTTK